MGEKFKEKEQDDRSEPRRMKKKIGKICMIKMKDFVENVLIKFNIEKKLYYQENALIK